MAGISDLAEVRRHLVGLYKKYADPVHYEDEYHQGLAAGIEVCMEHIDSMIEHEDVKMDRYHMAVRTMAKRD
jgi:hypothetical protein